MGIVITIVLAVLAAALMIVAKNNSTFVATLANVATIIATLAAIVMLVVSFPSSSSPPGDPPPTITQVSNTRATQAPMPASVTPTPASPPAPPPTNTRIPTVAPSPIPILGIGPTKTAKDGSLMMFIPAGVSLMGSTIADKDAVANEKPQHTVYLDAYWIGKYEVTNALYKKCVDAGKCSVPKYWINGTIPSGKENHPVVGVSWSDANAYAQWMGGRLPTEAEWEKAACWDEAKKVKRIYPWGDVFDAQKANTDESGIRDTTPVGKYSPQGDSPYGVSDMAGNAWEWVADWFSDTYYSTSPRNNPRGPDSGLFRVLVGGSWHELPDIARCAVRGGYDPVVWYYDVGFRVVVSSSSGF